MTQSDRQPASIRHPVGTTFQARQVARARKMLDIIGKAGGLTSPW
jgi:hypothetical protein